MPPVEQDGSINWFTNENIGVGNDKSLKGFYHGNLLYVVEEEHFDRAKDAFFKMFKEPTTLTRFFSCKNCNASCPNAFVYITHLHYSCQHGRCPEERHWEGSIHPPAFYIPEVVVNLFDRTIEEYTGTNMLPFDFINPRAVYQNFVLDKVVHTSQEIRDLVKQEKNWLGLPGQDNFLYVLITKHTMYRTKAENKDSVYRDKTYPYLLTMPYIDAEVAMSLLKNRRININIHKLEDVMKKGLKRGKGRPTRKRKHEETDSQQRKKTITEPVQQVMNQEAVVNVVVQQSLNSPDFASVSYSI